MNSTQRKFLIEKEKYNLLTIISDAPSKREPSGRLVTIEFNQLRVFNLSTDDVLFIRSKSFNYEKHRKNYNCSENILHHRTFKNLV